MKAFSPWLTKQGGKGLTSGSNIVRPRRRRSIGVILFLLVVLATYSSFDVSKWIGLSPRTSVGNEKQEEEDQGGWGGSFLHQSSNTELNQYFEERSHDHPYAQCSGKYFEIEGFLNDSELPDNILERLLSKSQIPQEENAGLDFSAVGISNFLVRGNASQSFLPVNSQHVPCKSDGCCSVKFFFRPKTTDFSVYQQVYIWHFMRYMYPLEKSFTPKYILDAGANAGFSTVLFKLIWPDAVVVSLEPDESNFEALQQNTKSFSGVHTLNAGLWGWKARIGLKGNHGEWGRVFFSKKWYQRGGMPAYGVNDIAEKFNIPAFDFVKIDIEGAEGMVFDPRADTSWVSKAQVVSLEIHDYFGNYFGLRKHQEISSRIDSQMKKYKDKFSVVSDNEHVMYIENEVIESLLEKN